MTNISRDDANRRSEETRDNLTEFVATTLRNRWGHAVESAFVEALVDRMMEAYDDLLDDLVTHVTASTGRGKW